MPALGELVGGRWRRGEGFVRVGSQPVEGERGVGDVQQLGPEGSPGSRFLFFEDADGNGWAVQER